MISGVASKGSEHSEAICTDAHVDAEDREDAETVEEPEQESDEGADEEDLEAALTFGRDIQHPYEQ